MIKSPRCGLFIYRVSFSETEIFMKMEDEPLISIVVPIYNVGDYIEKCIQSIIDQTYNNLQIILIDDGSTDNSGKICDEYAKIDQRIEVIHQDNKGLVVARMKGLEIARGEYTGFVDGDDYIEDNMYEKLLSYLIESDADFVHTGYWKNEYKLLSFEENIVEINEETDYYIRNYCLDVESQTLITPSLWSKLYKTPLIKKCYSKVPEARSYGEDLICLCACLMESNRIALKKEAFYHYTVRENSLSNNKNNDLLIEEYNLYKCLLNLFKEYGYYNQLKNVLAKFLKQHVLNAISKISSYEFQVAKYNFSDPEILQNKKIIIYGAGEVGKDYYSRLIRYTNVEVVAWADSYKKQNYYEYIKLIRKEEIKNYNFDYVIIAVKNKENADEIKKNISSIICDNSKIIWRKPLFLL